MALLEASPECFRGVSRASDNLAGGTKSLSLWNLLGLLGAHKSWGLWALGSLCPQLSALVSLCSGVFVSCVPRPALSFPWDEGSLCMAKQGRNQGPTTGAHGPVQSRLPQAKCDCTSGQLWAAMPLTTAPRSTRQWSTGQPVLHSFPILIYPTIPSQQSHPIPSCPAPSCSMALSF